MPDRRRSASALRVDDLAVQARFARERYDLYKARAYSDRPTSPGRLRELERECALAEASLLFARRQTKTAGEAAPERPVT